MGRIFNLSHSLGAGLLGSMAWVGGGRSAEAFAGSADGLVPLALVSSVLYLGIAIRHWFRIPIAGISLSTALFTSSFTVWCFGGS